jgi:putative dehydrogenase
MGSERQIHSTRPVGMIGLGLMGSALSARLIAAGIPVIGYDIDADRGEALWGMGGEVAVSSRRVLAQCQTTIIAVFSAEQIEALLSQIDRNAKSSLMICTTTCAPDEILHIGQRVRDANIAFIEAPISGTSAELRAGSAMALIAGKAEIITAAKAVLDALCPLQTIVGDIGDAARTKLAINLILQNNRAALAEGIAFAESLGLDTATFLATAKQSAAYSGVMDTKGDKMLARDFTPQSHIGQTLKDAELILDQAKRSGQSLPMTSAQTTLLRAAIAHLGGECDSAAIIEAIRPSRSRNGAAP